MRQISKLILSNKNISIGNFSRKLSTTHLVRNQLDKNYEKCVSIRQNNFPTFPHTFKKPILFTKGSMQWLYDQNGKKYLDTFGGIATVSIGHCHPKITNALTNQANQLWHTPKIYMHPKIHEYAEKLVSKMPGDLKVVYFVNSGSEANDLAMLLARLYTRNFEIISFRNAYHGGSPYTMGLTAQSHWKHPLPGINSGIHHVMNPDPYKGLWGGKHCRDSISQTCRNCDCSSNECKAEDNYINQLDELFKYSIGYRGCAAMFIESIQGVGGTVQYPKGYAKKAAELVRSHGGLFVCDEVQTGFGRTGDNFWGFQGHDIIPDIVTMAKGIGNGFPLGAVVTTKKIAEPLGQALHFNTFGGNPLASAVGLSVLEAIEEERIQENALYCGELYLKGLLELQQRHEIIGDVRGKGLMIGIEFVENKESRKPLPTISMLEILDEAKNLGVIFGTGGRFGNVIRIKPPMCINKENVDFTIEVLDKSLKKLKMLNLK